MSSTTGGMPNSASGRPVLGILMLEGKMAEVPGCMASAASFAYPVLHRVVPGSRPPSSVEAVEQQAAAYTAAARELVSAGARLLSDNCNGRMVLLSDRLSARSGLPTVLSALHLVPFVARLLPGRRIGILAFSTDELGEWHYQVCGFSSREIPLAALGVADSPVWREFLATKEAPPARLEQMSRELVTRAAALRERHPDLGAWVAECTLIPPCSQALRRALGLPVFDVLTLLDFVASGYRRAPAPAAAPPHPEVSP